MVLLALLSSSSPAWLPGSTYWGIWALPGVLSRARCLGLRGHLRSQPLNGARVAFLGSPRCHLSTAQTDLPQRQVRRTLPGLSFTTEGPASGTLGPSSCSIPLPTLSRSQRPSHLALPSAPGRLLLATHTPAQLPLRTPAPEAPGCVPARSSGFFIVHLTTCLP